MATGTKNVSIKDLIKSIGQTIFVIGIAYALFSVVIAAVLLSDGIAGDTKSLVYSVVLVVPLCAYWIYAGYSIKRLSDSPRQAERIVGMVMASVVVFTLVILAEALIYGISTGIVMMVAFSVYLYWSYRDLQSRLGTK